MDTEEVENSGDKFVREYMEEELMIQNRGQVEPDIVSASSQSIESHFSSQTFD